MRHAGPGERMGEGRYRIGELCGMFGLSRSSLLYYDRIGLLRPSGRCANSYRYYGEDARRRLERAMAYREAGLPLARIREVLDREAGPAGAAGEAPAGAPASAEALGARLREIDRSIGLLRDQKALALSLLGRPGDGPGASALDAFREALQRAGVREDQRAAIHREFEASAPEAHERFLRSVGFGEADIRSIRGGGL